MIFCLLLALRKEIMQRKIMMTECWMMCIMLGSDGLYVGFMFYVGYVKTFDDFKNLIGR